MTHHGRHDRRRAIPGQLAQARANAFARGLDCPEPYPAGWSPADSPADSPQDSADEPASEKAERWAGEWTTIPVKQWRERMGKKSPDDLSICAGCGGYLNDGADHLHGSQPNLAAPV